MEKEHYRYTYVYTDWDGIVSEEDCFINKDVFHPYGEVKRGQKMRGEFGFMRITKVFDEPHMVYGKFIAKSITYKEMVG